jgi:hypothetical protein
MKKKKEQNPIEEKPQRQRRKNPYPHNRISITLLDIIPFTNSEKQTTKTATLATCFSHIYSHHDKLIHNPLYRKTTFSAAND